MFDNFKVKDINEFVLQDIKTAAEGLMNEAYCILACITDKETCSAKLLSSAKVAIEEDVWNLQCALKEAYAGYMWDNDLEGKEKFDLPNSYWEA